MNAIQFIEEHGIEKARKVVEGAPRIGSYWQEFGVDNNKYYGYDDFDGSWYEYWDIPNAPMWQKVYSRDGFSFNRVPLKDLKRLVESVDHISDVNEMGDDSHIENHVSPNCKKYDERVKHE